MKRLIPFLLLASCTASQNERFAEHLAPPAKALELRNQHIAHEAFAYSDRSFAFSLQEMHPVETSKGPLSIYALKADGIPIGERFILASRNLLNGSVVSHFEFEVLEDNTLQVFTAKGDENLSEAPVILKDILKGQSVELAAVSKKRVTANSVTFVPTPLDTQVGDAQFSLHVTHRKGTHFHLKSSGLIPGEQILVTEQSGPEIRTHRIAADEMGSIDLPIEPIVFGKLGGEANVRIARAADESRIDYFWGGRLELESRREAIFHPLVFVANRDPKEIDFIALQPKLDKKLFL